MTEKKPELLGADGKRPDVDVPDAKLWMHNGTIHLTSDMLGVNIAVGWRGKPKTWARLYAYLRANNVRGA